MKFGQKVTYGNGLITLGDSFSVPYGLNATSPAHAYTGRLTAHVGGTRTSYAEGGTGTTKAANAASSLIGLRKQLITCMAGFNDIRKDGAVTIPKIKGNTRAAIAAAFSEDSVPASAMRSAGTWSALGSGAGGRALALGGTGRYTNDPNAYLEWDFFGETLVVGGIAATAGAGYKDFNVQVDGGSAVDFICAGQTDENYSLCALVLKDLGYSKHTVRLSPKDSSQWTAIDYVGTIGEPGAKAPMLVGEIPSMTNWTYAGFTLTPAELLAANDAIADVVDEFSWLPVEIVPVNDYYNVANGVSSDGAHPNDTGHWQIFEAFKSRISLWS
jgi:lysophospholipase L1-like esterase